MIRTLLLAFILLFSAQAGAFELPGLERDSNAYMRELQRKFPAGGSPQARRQAETRANDALRRNDWAGVVAAFETGIGLGGGTTDNWLTLARAQLRRTPPEATRALQAAWKAFGMADAGTPEIPPLLVIAEALRVMDRPAQAIEALEAVVERAPDDPSYKQQLADVRRAAGLLVRKVKPEEEADPPRACIAFTSAPSRRNDLVPGDWVRLDPPAADVAVTREGDQICVSGLRLGATTRITLRAGLPGEDGLTLKQDVVLNVAMGNRKPQLALENRLFVLPRGQVPRLTLTSVNLSSVKLTLLRVGERNIVPWVRDNRLGSDLERYSTYTLDESAKVVWEGRADIPGYKPNVFVRTALPLPDAFGDVGIYVLKVAPGDGTTNYNAYAAQAIVRTDLAPTVWRGNDGLTVQIRGYSDALPKAGVKVDLLARSNDILAQATTDADGIARFGMPLLRGEGPQAPQGLHLFHDQDFATLDLTAAAFDLADRGVSGMPHPGALDAYAWTDRGIYRPGETVHLMALLRDNAGSPADIPARVTVKRPNGQVFLQAVPPRGPDASVNLPITLSATAPIGTWTVELRADPARPPIGTASFRVDAFVPDRMAVELSATGSIVPGRAFEVPVVARYLYGAPGAGLTGKATLRLTADAQPPAALDGFRIGIDGEEFAPDAQELDLPSTDEQGRTTLTVTIPRAPDSTRPVRAQLDVSVDDPSGRAVHAKTNVPVRPVSNLIGIKPLFDGGSVDANAEAAFEIAAVNPDGARIALPAKMRLVRERPDWRRVTRAGTARYETTWRDEPLETQDVTIPASGTLRVAKKLDFGRYRLEVVELNGLAATSVRFRSGWVASDSPDVPDKADVSADKKQYPVGATARVHVAPPFAGHGTLLVVSDRVHAIRNIDVPAGGADFDVQVEASWGPGAYAVVHVFHPGGNADRPVRAIGVAWLGVDPAARKLDVTIDVPDKVTPRQRFTVPVQTAPGAWVTLAAVDEGILRLTGFESPDPAPHFLGRRRLGLDIRDDWGRLIRPGEGDATVLRQGGDEGGAALPEIPQKTVTLFVPPVQAGPDGKVMIPLDLPDFNGQVRLMVVSWKDDKIGAASKPLIVRDAMIAEPLLPRFLAPGDEARMAVLLQNLDLPGGQVAVEIRVEGPLALSGPSRLTADLDSGKQSLQATGLRGTGVGRGIIRLDVTGPGGYRVQRETAILVRPARPAFSVVAGAEMPPGTEARLSPPVDLYLDGTWSSNARFGGPVRYDVAALIRSLGNFPLNCLEQVTSQAFPLAMLPDGPIAGPDRASRLQAGVTQVLDRQRYDGAFAMWRANGEAEEWLTSYATEFLLRAKAAGAAVPDAAIADAVKFLLSGVENESDTPIGKAQQAYRLLAWRWPAIRVPAPRGSWQRTRTSCRPPWPARKWRRCWPAATTAPGRKRCSPRR